MIAEHDGVGIHFTTTGRDDGPPVLLVMGLGASGAAWWRLLPHLEAHARLLVVDNRGTGASDRVRDRLTMAGMAADLAAVLDAADVEAAHVVALSLGGMAAQHLALDHRDRVRSLVLGCTTAGGAWARRGPPWRIVASGALRRWIGPAGAFELLAPALYGPSTLLEHPERVQEDVAVRERDATPGETVLAQLAAAAGHDTRARLHELEGLPVTVLHGLHDGVIPPDDGRELAAAIPGAKLVMIPGCGHMLTTDAVQTTAQAVLELL